jgi:hypothetical protein
MLPADGAWRPQSDKAIKNCVKAAKLKCGKPEISLEK